MNTEPMEIDVQAVLQQYAGDTGIRSMKKVENDYVHVAERLHAEEMTAALSEAFRSENTSPFAQTVSQSYKRGNAGQRADILARLLEDASPIVVGPLQEAGMLQQSLFACDAGAMIVPTEAEKFHPELIQHIACQVEREDEEAIDKMSGYYADNLPMAKALGGSMLSVVLRKIAETR